MGLGFAPDLKQPWISQEKIMKDMLPVKNPPESSGRLERRGTDLDLLISRVFVSLEQHLDLEAGLRRDAPLEPPIKLMASAIRNFTLNLMNAASARQ